MVSVSCDKTFMHPQEPKHSSASIWLVCVAHLAWVKKQSSQQLRIISSRVYRYRLKITYPRRSCR